MRANQRYLEIFAGQQNWAETDSPPDLLSCHCCSRPLIYGVIAVTDHWYTIDFPLIYHWYVIFTGYSPLAPPSQSPPSLSNLLHSKQVMTQVANAPSPTASLSSLTGPAALSGQNKKYRPPHKTDKFTPKPIPPELGNLKTYSKYPSQQSSTAPSPWIVLYFSLICFNCFRLIFFTLQLTKQVGESLSLNVHSALTMNLNF